MSEKEQQTPDAMSKHTPGPWQITEMDLAGVEFFIVPPRSPACPINDIASLVIDGHPLGRDAQIANAKLIAAAPELLEALRLLLADVADYPAWQRPCLAVDKANAAIAKAIGAA
jgi:hypothetical protein